jgi:hypothetical protein
LEFASPLLSGQWLVVPEPNSLDAELLGGRPFEQDFAQVEWLALVDAGLSGELDEAVWAHVGGAFE